MQSRVAGDGGTFKPRPNPTIQAQQPPNPLQLRSCALGAGQPAAAAAPPARGGCARPRPGLPALLSIPGKGFTAAMQGCAQHSAGGNLPQLGPPTCSGRPTFMSLISAQIMLGCP